MAVEGLSVAIVKLENFIGEIPKLPSHLLPDHGAAEAVNCSFSHGELRSLQGPGPLKGTPQAVRSLFSDDGLRFCSWDKPTWARLGPTIDDGFGRVYFANHAGLQVTQTHLMQSVTSNPGAPGQSWRTGLPRPGKPKMTVTDKASGSLGITLYKEAGGAVVGPVAITHTEVVEPGREYLLTYGAGQSDGKNNQAITESVDAVFIDGVRAVIDTDHLGHAMPGSYVAVAAVCKVRRFVLVNTSLVIIPPDGKRLNGLGTPYSFDPIRGGYPVSYIIKNGHEYTAETFYALLKEGKITSATGSGKNTVLDGGTWLSTESRLTAKVQGSDWFAFSSGSVQEGNNASIGVTLEQEGEGKVRIKISYGDKASAAYAVTFVNQWNEESQASEPVVVALDGSQTVKVSLDYQGFSEGVPVTGMHVYRTYGTSDAYLLINEAPMPASSGTTYTFVDVDTTPQTSTLLKTSAWEAPHESLRNIAYVGNGFLAGSVGKDLYFSEPYHPHAWPYAMTFPHAIMGVEAVEGGLLVTTLGKPYMVYGTHPEQMMQQMVDTDQAGVSGRSLIRVEGNAVFASNDGLVTVSGGQASLSSSQQLFTRKDWRQRYQAVFHNLVLGAHDGAIVGLVDPGYPGSVPATDGFVIRLDEEGGSYTRLRLPIAPLGVSIVPEEDALYLGFSNGFAEFGAGDDLEFIWRSKDFTFPQPITFGAVVMDCSPGVTVSFFCNQHLVHAHQVVEGQNSFRLPSIAPQKTWAVKFVGTGYIKKFEMASSFAELKHG